MPASVSDSLFDTWEGDDSTLEGDLTRVLKKHGVDVAGLSAEQLTIFVSRTLGALDHAEGSTVEFTTSMFMLYKETEVPRQPRFARNTGAIVTPLSPTKGSS